MMISTMPSESSSSSFPKLYSGPRLMIPLMTLGSRYSFADSEATWANVAQVRLRVAAGAADTSDIFFLHRALHVGPRLYITVFKYLKMLLRKREDAAKSSFCRSRGKIPLGPAPATRSVERAPRARFRIPPTSRNVKPPECMHSGGSLLKREDSNLRWSFPHAAFRVRCLRPLSHASKHRNTSIFCQVLQKNV